MSSISKENILKEFEIVIRKSPLAFDEVLVKLASEHGLPEEEILMLKKDVLFIVLVVITMENGFRPKMSDGGILEDARDIDAGRLATWKLSSGLYEAEFILGLCDMSTKLMMIPLNNSVLVNLAIIGIESEVYSVCIPIDKYIVLTKDETVVAKLFRNLQKLSDAYKNKVLSPVKSKLLTICGYPGASLMGLPEDMFLKLMLYLSIHDIISVSKTCKTFNQMLDDNSFWHKLFLRDYAQFKKVQDDNNWYRIFVKNEKLAEANKRNNWKLKYKEHYLECINIKLVCVFKQYI